jgi:hypothetical protein
VTYQNLKLANLAPIDAALLSMTPLSPKTILRLPLYFLCDCYSYRVVIFAFVCFYFIFIYIPFEGSQSLSNSRSPCTAVSYWHSGVNETAVPATAVSTTPLFNRLRDSKPFSKTL